MDVMKIRLFVKLTLLLVTACAVINMLLLPHLLLSYYRSPRLRILPLPDVPGLNGVVRADRRSLKELNSPPVSASLDASPEGFKKPDG